MNAMEGVAGVEHVLIIDQAEHRVVVPLNVVLDAVKMADVSIKNEIGRIYYIVLVNVEEDGLEDLERVKSDYYFISFESIYIFDDMRLLVQFVCFLFLFFFC